MQPKEIIRRLGEIQFKFDKPATEEKLSLIEKLAPSAITEAEEIMAYHDRLLCILAFPDNQKVFNAASIALQLLSEKIKFFLVNADENEIWKLTEAAVMHSTIRASFSYEVVKWLADNYPEDGTFSGCEASKDIVAHVFKQLLPPAVAERLFDNHEHTLEQLAKKAWGKSKAPDILRWTLTQFASSPISDKSKEQLFELLHVYVEWKINSFSPTRTFARAEKGCRYFFGNKQVIHHADIKKVFRDKKLNPISLSSSEKKNLCDIAKGVLCSNYREIDPIAYAENSDTELYDMGRGITIGLYFMRPGWRLSCEGYVSYMAFRNGVPISYGGSWLFFDRIKLAGNVFPPFRGGESAYVFAELYRLYYLRFGANCFHVDPYQIGQKNEDAITSGAFWFYYRLGFRPNDSKLLALAKEEAAKRVKDKQYRTPATVLRKFAHTDMVLNLLPTIHISHQALLQKMQALVASEHEGNFAEYFQTCFSLLSKSCRQNKLTLPVRLNTNAQAMELCGIVSVFSDYSQFSKSDLKKFVSALEEKAFGSERNFLKTFDSIKQLREDIYKFSSGE